MFTLETIVLALSGQSVTSTLKHNTDQDGVAEQIYYERFIFSPLSSCLTSGASQHNTVHFCGSRVHMASSGLGVFLLHIHCHCRVTVDLWRAGWGFGVLWGVQRVLCQVLADGVAAGQAPGLAVGRLWVAERAAAVHRFSSRQSPSVTLTVWSLWWTVESGVMLALK